MKIEFTKKEIHEKWDALYKSVSAMDPIYCGDLDIIDRVLQQLLEGVSE